MSSRIPVELTRKKILYAALDLLDEEGLKSLSMRNLGARLGVKAMSIYNHIENKKALLDGIIELLLEEMVIPPETSDWKADISAFAHAYRTVLLRHPKALPVVATCPVATKLGMKKVEYALSILSRGGLKDLKTIYALHVFASFIIGHALIDVGEAPEVEMPNSSALPQGLSLNESLDEFPYISCAFSKMEQRSSEDEFDFGLNLLLSSLHA